MCSLLITPKLHTMTELGINFYNFLSFKMNHLMSYALWPFSHFITWIDRYKLIYNSWSVFYVTNQNDMVITAASLLGVYLYNLFTLRSWQFEKIYLCNSYVLQLNQIWSMCLSILFFMHYHIFSIRLSSGQWNASIIFNLDLLLLLLQRGASLDLPRWLLITFFYIFFYENW